MLLAMTTVVMVWIDGDKKDGGVSDCDTEDDGVTFTDYPRRGLLERVGTLHFQQRQPVLLEPLWDTQCDFHGRSPLGDTGRHPQSNQSMTSQKRNLPLSDHIPAMEEQCP